MCQCCLKKDWTTRVGFPRARVTTEHLGMDLDLEIFSVPQYCISPFMHIVLQFDVKLYAWPSPPCSAPNNRTTIQKVIKKAEAKIPIVDRAFSTLSFLATWNHVKQRGGTYCCPTFSSGQRLLWIRDLHFGSNRFYIEPVRFSCHGFLVGR